MRWLLWFLVLAVSAVGLSLAVRYNEGYALLVVPPWRIEVSLNFLILSLVIGFMFGYAVLRAVINFMRMPQTVKQYRLRQIRQKAEMALQESMRHLQEGRYGRALKNAEIAFDAGYAPGVASLLALRSAHALHDEERFALWQQRARAHEGANGRAARLMTEARLALENRDFDKGHALLEELAAQEGRHIAAQRLALGIEQGRQNWPEVLRLTRQLEKHRALTAEQAAPLRLRAHRENLWALRADSPRLLAYWKKMTDADRADSTLAAEAAKALAEGGDCIGAAALIEDFLDEQWDSQLAGIYGQCQGGDVLARIAHGEKWLQLHPRDARLLLTLGSLCQQKQLWGKAQSYFEASLGLAPSRDGHLALAQLLDQLGRTGEADRHFRQAALLPA